VPQIVKPDLRYTSALPHLVAPLLAVLLLIAVLGAQFLAATNPDQYPGLLPQYQGTIIVGGWLALGIVWALALHMWRPAALEAGERIYVETEAPPATPEANSVSPPALAEAPETAAPSDVSAAPIAAEPQARGFEPALDGATAPAVGETVVVAEAELPIGVPPSASLATDAAPAPDASDAPGDESADLVIVTEMVVVVEDATTSAPNASNASNASDLVGAPTGEETATAEPSSEPAAEERQEPLQQA
jgi:hypothetical protein